MTELQRMMLECLLKKDYENARALARTMDLIELSQLGSACEYGWDIAETAYEERLDAVSRSLDV